MGAPGRRVYYGRTHYILALTVSPRLVQRQINKLGGTWAMGVSWIYQEIRIIAERLVTRNKCLSNTIYVGSNVSNTIYVGSKWQTVVTRQLVQ